VLEVVVALFGGASNRIVVLEETLQPPSSNARTSEQLIPIQPKSWDCGIGSMSCGSARHECILSWKPLRSSHERVILLSERGGSGAQSPT
jgi:hypothetical protein